MSQISVIPLIPIAIEAGSRILEVYETDFDVELKADQSPLTMADRESHQVIVNGLHTYYPELPILSEEGRSISYDERKGWESFFLVDPLDGTKEFVKKNGEFTVNIALIEGNKPVLGVIYCPVLDHLYIGKAGFGCYKIEHASEITFEEEGDIIDNGTALPSAKQDGITIVASRSHMSDATVDFIKELEKEHGTVKTISAGSSLKLCLVAEGKAQYYPRFAPTMEWDTAAGHAIVESAGGKVLLSDESGPLVYNKEDLLNPWFLCKSK